MMTTVTRTANQERRILKSVTATQIANPTAGPSIRNRPKSITIAIANQKRDRGKSTGRSTPVRANPTVGESGGPRRNTMTTKVIRVRVPAKKAIGDRSTRAPSRSMSLIKSTIHRQNTATIGRGTEAMHPSIQGQRTTSAI